MNAKQDTEYYSIQPEKPGYCLDPFQPFYGIHIAEDGLVGSLYSEAIELDRNYIKGDFVQDLDHWIFSIKKDLLSFYSVGLVAWKIKLMKAWDKRCSSFAEFCSRYLGRTAANVNNYIRAAVIISELIAARFTQLPQSVSQCLILYKHYYGTVGAEILCDTWGTIIDKYPPEKITAEIIELETMPIDERPPQMKQIRIPIDVWERLRETAADAGITPNQLLENMFPPEPEPEPELSAIDGESGVKEKPTPKTTPPCQAKKKNAFEQFIQQAENFLTFGDESMRTLSPPPPPPSLPF